MNPFPVAYTSDALDGLRALPVELRPAALELLTQIGMDHERFSRPATFPRLRGRESGLWCRYADGRVAFLEVLFHLEVEPDRIVVRRVLCQQMARLPGWIANPAEWPGEKPWPVVDL